MESKMPSMRSGLWTGMFRPCGVTLLRATELLHEAGFECAELCERYAAETLGINVDSAHALAAGDRPEEVIGAFAGRVFGVHLSDSDGKPRDLHLIPGRGIADWSAILIALRRSGYDGDFHLELPHERVSGDLDATFANACKAARAAP